MKRAGVLALAALVVTLSSLAFGDEFKMRSSEYTPATIAVVHANSDRNGNLDITLDAKHLAPPDRLSQPHQAYVIWIQAPGKQPEELGQLRVNTDNMEASFRTKTPYHSFDIFVTAEDNTRPEMPSSVEVLRGSVQK
jgi:hypothetical protein